MHSEMSCFPIQICIHLLTIIANHKIKTKMFRKYNILVPTLLKPSSSLVVVVHMLRIEEPLHSGLIGGKRTVMVTVKLLRGGQSVEEVILIINSPCKD